MAGDYTRFRYNPLKDTTGILMQQGRVLLDQDWNEYVQLQDRRWRAETIDIIGRAVYPTETPHGFELKFVGGTLTIGIGRMYVDGLMAENHGVDPTNPTTRTYDPILGELIGTLPIPYDQQPYFPNPPALPHDTDLHVVYLDVWERELTYLEDPGLVDQAVAVDTATRLQTVWQVKVLADSAKSIDCPSPLPDSLISPSAGQLTTKAAGVSSSTDPCIVPANGGYRGSGNRCYRIEIHTGGAMGTAQFKWSHDNASVASAVTSINASLDTLTVVLTKRDSVLRFQPNDWVEVTDDFHYFAGLPGEMHQVAVVDDVNLTIKLKDTLLGVFDATKPERHTRVIRWDQRGIVRDPLNNVIVDVDANGGLIPVLAAGTTVVLEDGIQVTFSVDAAISSGIFKNLDYWLFSARVIDASVELLDQAPPLGIHHHFAKLGFINSTTVSDCRVPWPPASGESCDCTVCVSALSHNSGTLTIQKAINILTEKGGGKVCLGPGVYNINETIVISGTAAIEISGHGLPSLQATSKLSARQPVIRVERSIDIMIEDLSIAAGMKGNEISLPGIVLRNTYFVRIKRCAFVFGTDGTIIPGGRTLDPSIALSIQTVDTSVEECFFNNVSIGIGDDPQPPEEGEGRMIFALSVERNQLVCSQSGARLMNPVTAFSEVRFAENFVQAPIGFSSIGVGLDVSFDANTINLVPFPPSTNTQLSVGILSNLSQTRISANHIFGNSDTPNMHDGIMLGASNTTMWGTQVTGNNINNLSGNAISMIDGAVLLESIISQNQIFNIGGSGIVMLFEGNSSAVASGLNISGNSLVGVGLTPSPSGDMVGIQLVTAINVAVAENRIERIGPNPALSAVRIGIEALLVYDLRIAGNGLSEIGPPGPGKGAGGIMAIAYVRADITDNKVRRALNPPPGGDTSPFSSLSLIVGGDISVRGNLLEGFGVGKAADVFASGACIFSENQCFWENPKPADEPAVLIRAQEGIVSANYVNAPTDDRKLTINMEISFGNNDRFVVVANYVRGQITANGEQMLPAHTIPAFGEKLNNVS